MSIYKHLCRIILVLWIMMLSYIVKSNTIQTKAVTIHAKALQRASKQIRKSPDESYETFKVSLGFF